MLETDEDFDPATRQLCPDGNCTGVLDEAGVCKVCGARGAPAPAGTSGEASDAADAAGAAGAEAPAASDGAGDDEITTRQLCPDGACIGIIGPDGKCKVCGRSAS
jgi:hypothetical protein